MATLRPNYGWPKAPSLKTWWRPPVFGSMSNKEYNALRTASIKTRPQFWWAISTAEAKKLGRK